MAATDDTQRRVGEIAAETGLTVRTLHHYEAIGLIEPSGRTDAGHRLYGGDAVERLYQVSALRNLGMGLDRVRRTLSTTGVELEALLVDHLDAVDRRLEAEQRLRNRLHRLVDRLERHESEVATDDLLSVLEDMTMLEPTVDRRIAILVYDDLEAAHEYLTRVFGFGPGTLTRDGDGNVVHGEIHAGDGEFWLHPEAPEFKLHPPNALGGASGTMAILVDDVDAHHAHAVGHGAEIRYEPVDQPYGYREYSAVDPAGHLWSFMKPLEAAES